MLSDTPVTLPATTPPTVPQPASSLCATGLTPARILVGAMLMILRGHFGRSARLDSGLRPVASSVDDGLIYRGPGSQSGMVIDHAGKFDPATAGTRPAIYVRRGTFERQSVSIGDRRHGVLPIDGKSPHGVLQVGSLICTTCASSEAEADMLGTEVYNYLTEFGPRIRSDLRLSRFRPMQNMEPALLEEVKDPRTAWAVVISTAVAFWHGWNLHDISPRTTFLYVKQELT